MAGVQFQGLKIPCLKEVQGTEFGQNKMQLTQGPHILLLLHIRCLKTVAICCTGWFSISGYKNPMILRH